MLPAEDIVKPTPYGFQRNSQTLIKRVVVGVKSSINSRNVKNCFSDNFHTFISSNAQMRIIGLNLIIGL